MFSKIKLYLKIRYLDNVEEYILPCDMLSLKFYLICDLVTKIVAEFSMSIRMYIYDICEYCQWQFSDVDRDTCSR